MGGTSKKNALKRLFNNHKASVIMLQETMLAGKRAKEIIRGLLKNWEMESLDAVGHSGGLITA